MIYVLRATGLAALTFAAFLTGAQAQDYPSRPIRIILPSATGSGPDVDTRSVAAELSKVLKQTVLVENRPGASNRIGIGGGRQSHA